MFVIIFLCIILNSLAYFECYGTHYEFGYCIGEKTSHLISKRYNASQHFEDLYWWVNTPNGSQVLQLFVNNNKLLYPQYFEEINGISDGSNIDITKILVMTFDDELSYFSPNFSEINGSDAHRLAVSCSDYLLQNYDNNNKLISYYMAHNEDNLAEDINITFLVKGKINNGIEFLVYSYAGELLTQAFGFNSYISFSSNFVHPANPVLGGIGRNFIGRLLMDQTNLKDAMNAVKTDGQCGGHNYQISEWKTGNMTGAEVAYNSLHAFTLINNSYNWTFHANRYIHLNISQIEDDDYTSSMYREERAQELGRPNNLSDMLNYLGDNENEEYPIYKTGPSDYTLHTYGVDLVNCKYYIYANNPKDRIVINSGDVTCLDPIY